VLQVKKSSVAGKEKTPFLVVLATKGEYKASKKFLKNVLLHLARENQHAWQNSFKNIISFRFV